MHLHQSTSTHTSFSGFLVKLRSEPLFREGCESYVSLNSLSSLFRNFSSQLLAGFSLINPCLIKAFQISASPEEMRIIQTKWPSSTADISFFKLFCEHPIESEKTPQLAPNERPLSQTTKPLALTQALICCTLILLHSILVCNRYAGWQLIHYPTVTLEHNNLIIPHITWVTHESSRRAFDN